MNIRNHFVHGVLLKSKSIKDPGLKPVYESYLRFINNISSLKIDSIKSIRKFVTEYNVYRESVLYTIESRLNSGQENLRSSMLEEFFCHLFFDLIKNILPVVPPNLILGKANSYVDLSFAPSSFKEIFINPNPYIHTKDQDFVLGVSVELTIKTNNGTEILEHIIVPVLAIECKTYIERNMLDSCSGTARRLKNAMPILLIYCGIRIHEIKRRAT